AHALDDLPGDGPVGEIALLAHFHRSQDGRVDVAAADHGERVGAGEVGGSFDLGHRLLPRVHQVGIDLRLGRVRADPEHAVLGLEDDVDALGQVVRGQRGQADAEVDVHPVLQ